MEFGVPSLIERFAPVSRSRQAVFLPVAMTEN
jgi:hypothetical protein